MSRYLLRISLTALVLFSFILPMTLGCSNSENFAAPLYISPGDNPYDEPDRYVMSIYVAPAGVNIVVSGMQQFYATAYFNDGSTENITKQVEWITENPSVGIFEIAGGRFLSQAPGVAIVRCRITQGGNSLYSSASYINSFLPNAGMPPDVPLNPTVIANDEGVVINWDKNKTDGDLAGYNIWRTQTSVSHYASDFGKVNEHVILYPPYLDETVVDGWYFYRVTAEDIVGVNGAPSSEAAVFVTGHSHYGSAYD